MKHIIKILLLICTIQGSVVQAQQLPGYSHYPQNTFLINPAMAGANPYAEATAIYRRQWLGFADAPETQLLSVNGSLAKDRLGLGLTAYNDVLHIIGRTGVAATAAYRLQVSQSQYFRFGLSLGFLSNRIFFDRIRAQDPEEEALLQNMESKTAPDGNAGIVYVFKNLQLGFSVHQLFQSELQYQNVKDAKHLGFEMIRHYNGFIRYLQPLGASGLAIEPWVFVKSAQGQPLQFDINLLLRYKEKLWLGATYNDPSTITASFGYVHKERFTIGYAYQHPFGQLSQDIYGTHEFMLGFRFALNKNKPLVVENQATPETKDTENTGMITLEEERRMQALEESYKRLSEEVRMGKERLKGHDVALREVNEKLEKEKQALLDAIEQLKTKSAARTTPGTSSSGDVVNDVTGLFYVVMGSFTTQKYAEVFQKMIKMKFDMGSQIIKSEAVDGKEYYLVYSRSYTSKLEAEQELERVKHNITSELLEAEEPWIYNK